MRFRRRQTNSENTCSSLFFGTDGHGSVRVLYDLAAAIARDTQNLAQYYTYDAYGNLLSIGGSSLTPNTLPLTTYLYSGEFFDFRIGQQYLRARWYDPTTGRVNRLDPFAGNSSDPQSFHEYAYVHGNPVTGVDPTGMFLESLWDRVKSDAANLAALASAQFRILSAHILSAFNIYRNLGLQIGGVAGTLLNRAWLVTSVSGCWAAF